MTRSPDPHNPCTHGLHPDYCDGCKIESARMVRAIEPLLERIRTLEAALIRHSDGKASCTVCGAIWNEEE